MRRPLAIDLYAGLGGWTDGLMAEGYDVIGFDIERHVYGEARYPAQLVIQDVLTIHGSRFKDAALIVGSSPCQEFSYRAMPWKRAKALPPPYLGMELFNAQFRIQREASAAAGHHIPLVVENVCGAQKWVGRARWHYGSFYLWGDVPALMPITLTRIMKRGLVGGAATNFHRDKCNGGRSTKNDGGSWFNVAHNTTSGHGQNPDGRPIKNGGDWFGSGDNCSLQRRAGSKSSARKAASAHIAKIPLPLARWIARAWHPHLSAVTA